MVPYFLIVGVLRVGRYGTVFQKKKIEVLKLPKNFKNLSGSICEYGFQTTVPKNMVTIFSNTEYPYYKEESSPTKISRSALLICHISSTIVIKSTWPNF
jgi:hypothetical protein